jgi:flavin reductase (DIM6/NTAB) family NADH-FMN oxidoreductase RutF
VTIHDTFPFPTDDDPVRRLRGRLGGQVSLWTTGAGPSRVGLTVSSLLVVNGAPGSVVGAIDPDSDLADALALGSPLVVQLLAWQHRMLAEAFAGVAPAPGGPFRAAAYAETGWGPRLADAIAWAGARVTALAPLGWSLLVTAELEHVEVGEDADPLMHRRGRYSRG